MSSLRNFCESQQKSPDYESLGVEENSIREKPRLFSLHSLYPQAPFSVSLPMSYFGQYFDPGGEILSVHPLLKEGTQQPSFGKGGRAERGEILRCRG
jgi:hypothetical protein